MENWVKGKGDGLAGWQKGDTKAAKDKSVICSFKYQQICFKRLPCCKCQPKSICDKILN